MVAEVEVLRLDGLAKLIGRTYITDIANIIMKELENDYWRWGKVWGAMNFDPDWDCSGIIGHYCFEVGYHFADGPAGRELDDVFHEALHQFAQTEEGKKLCKTVRREVACRLTQHDIAKVFEKFVAPLINGKILVMYASEGEVYVFWKKEKE